ncbi:MAG: hypothetical protein R3Y06_00080 [Faecalibacterium sp.]
MFLNKKKCTAQTTGVVKKVYLNRAPGRRLAVEYLVNGQPYTLTENVSSKSEAIKFGPFIVGQRKIEYISQGVGGIVSVSYNPNEPTQAFLTENIGWYA